MRFLFVILLVIFSAPLKSQDCYPEFFTKSFTTQLEIDSFIIKYPDCRHLYGIEISGTDITNFNGISHIERCNELYIHDTNLTSLLGLENLTEIYAADAEFTFNGMIGILIQNNPFLESLDGLENVIMTSNVKLINNPMLKNLDVFANCEFDFYEPYSGARELGNIIHIIDNEHLESISGLGNITQSSEIIIKNNPKLNDLLGLENISTVLRTWGLSCVAGGVLLENNDALKNLEGLEKLSVIAEDLIVMDNDSLESISGLNVDILRLQCLIIQNNPQLVDLNDLPALVQSSSWEVRPCIQIENNISLSSISGLSSDVMPPPDSIFINDNPELMACSTNFICSIQANPDVYLEVNNNGSNCNSITDISEACLTDVTENDLSNHIRVFPNPASKQLIIYLESGDQESYNIKIVGTDGSMHYEGVVIEGKEETVNLSPLSDGIYVLIIQTTGGLHAEKLIVQR